jgi:hypothetical protein
MKNFEKHDSLSEYIDSLNERERNAKHIDFQSVLDDHFKELLVDTKKCM